MPRGPKGELRPADVNARAVPIAKIATGEITEPLPFSGHGFRPGAELTFRRNPSSRGAKRRGDPGVVGAPRSLDCFAPYGSQCRRRWRLRAFCTGVESTIDADPPTRHSPSKDGRSSERPVVGAGRDGGSRRTCDTERSA
jgi:hypothetical protein